LLKKVFFTFLQFLLFLLVAFLGITMQVLHIIPSHLTKLGDGTRGFEWDGVYMMLALLVLILIVEALRKRIRTAAPWTLLALMLAAVAEYVMKLGIRDL
jgi:uncharacterized BrkB/YihY/UPF0761 family membrane protein